VIYRGRELLPDQLASGDVVALTVKEDPPGRYYSDFLSIRERREGWGTGK
jgi:hypothetical protein